ncbi:MAG: hypothetical protein GC192_17350 [Bacteroidetes bacterium]|nr:hypothetical protein [Bacteroidota bacterium]
MEKYKNKYRIPSTRLKGYDYGQMGAYFITICTQGRVHFFGEVVNGEMQLNEIGQLAFHEWERTIVLRPDMNLELGAFVVMPNHFHAVIIIGENAYNGGGNAARRDAMHGVSTSQPGEYQNQFAPQSKNLASIVRGFKSAVTTGAKKMGHVDFVWQTRFHEHIIRNEQSFETIQGYIIANALNWEKDKFYSY